MTEEEKTLNGLDEVLRRASENAVTSLTAAVNRDPASGQIFACLELFMEDVELSYNTYSIKAGGEELDVNYEPFDESHSEFIPGMTEYLGEALSGTPLSEADGIALSEKINQRIFDWMSEC